jgi:LysR family cyn operon transcriptional activator
MELRQVRYFIRVAELLHFTHAAESLHVSQSTLSTQIQQLEEEIGCPLFDRGRNLRLTEAGQLLLARARRCYRELELAKEEIGDLRQLLRGALSFGTTHMFSQKFVPSVLAAYAAAYPKVQVSMHVGSDHAIEQEILTRTIDVGLACIVSETAEIEYEELFCEELVLIVPKQHSLAGKTEIDARELSSFPLLLPSNGFSIRHFVDQYFLREKISPKVISEINDFSAIFAMVKTRNLATFGCRGATVNDTGIHAISLSGTAGPLTLSKGLLRSKDVPLSAAARAFVELTKSGYLLNATERNRLWFDQGCKRDRIYQHSLLGQAIE